MKYSVARFSADVMGRLGEIARPQDQSDASDVPWPEDIVALRVRSLLGEIGTRLITGAPHERLGDGVPLSGQASMRLMPCGLYAAEVPLPPGSLRLVSARMSGWIRNAVTSVLPGSPDWSRQWSAEPGIAGCPSAPRVYVDRDVTGLMLRLVGSVSEDDSPELVSVLTLPEPDGEDKFDFPEILYQDLIREIAESMC